MRSVWCFNTGNDLQMSADRKVKWRLWSNTHLEIELQLPEIDRYPVLHCIARPGKKLLIGGSLENKLDFIFGLTFFEFDHLDSVCPKIARLLENTYQNKRHDAVLTRSIEPYTKQIQWFLLTEIDNPGPVDFTASNVFSIAANKTVNSNAVAMVSLGDDLLEDRNPSALRSIWQGIKKGVGIYASHKAGGFVEQFLYKPKLVSAMEQANESSQKLEKYRTSFLKGDFYNIFER